MPLLSRINIIYWRPRICFYVIYTYRFILAQHCLWSPFLYKLIGAQFVFNTWYFFRFTRFRVSVYFSTQVKRTVWRNFRGIEAGFFLTFSKVRTQTSNYSSSFHLTSQPTTDVNMKFWRQRSDPKNLFPHKYPQFFAFLRQTFQVLHRNPTRFAITTSRLRHSRTTRLSIHKFSLTRSQFISIFYLRYTIMLMMYKWLHCLL